MVEQTQEPQQQRDGWQDVGWHRLGKDDAGNDELESQPADKQETVAKKNFAFGRKKRLNCWVRGHNQHPSKTANTCEDNHF